jgi:glycosyltransferase involved in cell wall biosynthesis
MIDRGLLPKINVLGLGTIFPNEKQPNLGVFSALAFDALSEFASVRYVAPVPWFPGFGLLSRRERSLSRIPPKSQWGRVPVTHPRLFRTPGCLRFLHPRFYVRSLRQHLRDLAAEKNPDVILATFAHPDGVAAVQLGRELKIPVVIKCIGSDVHQLLYERRRGTQILDAMHACAGIVTVSRSLRDILVKFGVPENKIDIVYNGVDREKFSPQPQSLARQKLKLPAGRWIVCVGNLQPIKRHKDLLEAFVQVRSRVRGAKLAIVGDGALEKELHDLARALGVCDDVYFAGARLHTEIPLWMNAADTVCLASANEGMPNVLCEALACGRPVVATAVGGIPELIDCPEAGRLVAPCNPADLARGLIEVLQPRFSTRPNLDRPELNSWRDSASALLRSLHKAIGIPATRQSPVETRVEPAATLRETSAENVSQPAAEKRPAAVSAAMAAAPK